MERKEVGRPAGRVRKSTRQVRKMNVMTAQTSAAKGSQVRQSARERLLAAANDLFYREGVHTVGIDRVIDQAGVAKASLYNTFGSKDELVAAYLEGRRANVTTRITRYLERYTTPREKLLGVFQAHGQPFAPP